jgi:hypothetical protein
VQEGSIGFLDFRWRLFKIIAIPMTLHGIYDTALKKELGSLALLVALFSFGWIAMQIEQMFQQEARIRIAEIGV